MMANADERSFEKLPPRNGNVVTDWLTTLELAIRNDVNRTPDIALCNEGLEDFLDTFYRNK
jgi:hypothetical protein